MLEESNKRSSENHNCLTFNFDTKVSLGTLFRIENVPLIKFIRFQKGVFKKKLEQFFIFWRNFCNQKFLFVQILGFMEYTLVYSCVCKLQIKLRF